MKAKRIFASALAASVALGPVQSMAGDALAGAVVGAVIGGLIVNEHHRNKNRGTVRQGSRPAGISGSQRESNREVQTALNYFGYHVGTPDGAMGPRSRAGISQYQALMGWAPSGTLSDFERSILVSAWQRGVIGGPATAQIAATHPQGVRGLLLDQRDSMFGVPGQTVVAAAPAAPVAPAPALPQVANAPAAGGLPVFMGQGAGAGASLASWCNKVSLMTNTNGGFVTVANMTDANRALSEQFCLARTYAMATGEEAQSRVQGASPQQVAEQCAGLGPAMNDQVTALSLQPRDAVLGGVSDFVLSAGMAPAQLAETARICLASGYTTDRMDVAIGSALLLTVLGERAYAELLGHHLSQGFGASQRRDLAIAWYETGIEAGARGALVFAPGMAERTELIRVAAAQLGGGQPAQTVPVFSVPGVAPKSSMP